MFLILFSAEHRKGMEIFLLAEGLGFNNGIGLVKSQCASRVLDIRSCVLALSDETMYLGLGTLMAPASLYLYEDLVECPRPI